MSLYSAGLREVWFLELDSAGKPVFTGAGPYDGIKAIGGVEFTLNIPDPRRVDHFGDDITLATQYLPAREGMTANLTIAANQPTLNALLSGVKVWQASATTEAITWGTDRQGKEADIAVVLTQSALDTATKTARYRTLVILRSRAVAEPPGMNENQARMAYRLTANTSDRNLLWMPFDVTRDGVKVAAFWELHTEKPTKFAFWHGDGVTTTFSFPSEYPVASANSVVVAVDGTIATATVNVARNSFSLSTAPANGALVAAKYEYA